MAPELTPTDRTRLRRHADRAEFDRELIEAIIDESPMCHVGVVLDRDGDPFPLVVPMVHGRNGEMLYLHGALANTTLAAAVERDLCVTFTLLDGFVLARSAFNHSVNYRSVVLFGRAERVTDHDEQLTAARVITDHMLPGRSDAVRAPNDSELRRTAIVRLAISEASAKVRSGPPTDQPEDAELPVWAGVIPTAVVAGRPVPDEFTLRSPSASPPTTRLRGHAPA